LRFGCVQVESFLVVVLFLLVQVGFTVCALLCEVARDASEVVEGILEVNSALSGEHTAISAKTAGHA